jgi:hypothetical protein
VSPKEIPDILRKAKIPVTAKDEKAMLKHNSIKGKKEVTLDELLDAAKPVIAAIPKEAGGDGE